MTQIYDFKPAMPDGTAIDLNEYRGKVLLIVNTASKCGFTPQYEGLEALHRKYADKGLTVMAFPCNQFGAQEPGDAEEIANFCSLKYDVSFQEAAKIDVNGDNAAPLWSYLKDTQPGLLGSTGIKWNFTKFLVGKDGEIIDRYAPNTKPEALEGDIKTALAA